MMVLPPWILQACMTRWPGWRLWDFCRIWNMMSVHKKKKSGSTKAWSCCRIPSAATFHPTIMSLFRAVTGSGISWTIVNSWPGYPGYPIRVLSQQSAGARSLSVQQENSVIKRRQHIRTCRVCYNILPGKYLAIALSRIKISSPLVEWHRQSISAYISVKKLPGVKWENRYRNRWITKIIQSAGLSIIMNNSMYLVRKFNRRDEQYHYDLTNFITHRELWGIAYGN